MGLHFQGLDVGAHVVWRVTTRRHQLVRVVAGRNILKLFNDTLKRKRILLCNWRQSRRSLSQRKTSDVAARDFD